MPKSIFPDEERIKKCTNSILPDPKHSASRTIKGPNGNITITCDGMTAEEAVTRVKGAAMYFNVKR